MNNEDKILEMLASMQKDITAIREDLTELKEDHQITRYGVNKLLEWSETAGYIIRFPLDKAK